MISPVEIATKIFWALGYNQVEMFISTFDPQKVVIEPGATKKDLVRVMYGRILAEGQLMGKYQTAVNGSAFIAVQA